MRALNAVLLLGDRRHRNSIAGTAEVTFDNHDNWTLFIQEQARVKRGLTGRTKNSGPPSNTK